MNRRFGGANYIQYDWWRRSAIPHVVKRAARRYYDVRPSNGIAVMAEDWDNLLILDACRYDMFETMNTIPGDLRRRTSRASSTPEFIEENFVGESFHDTVYVTANPYVDSMLDEVFYRTVSVWETHWNDELNTVLPQDVAAATRDAFESHPDKRIVSHFMQPHYPFIGETGRNRLAAHSGFEYSLREAKGEDPHHDDPTIWKLVEDGVVDRSLAIRAYGENLELVLPHVEGLVRVLDGKTVVTADHGNLVGELVLPFPLRLYGHPYGIHAKPLVTIPWLEVSGSEERRTVRAEEPITTDDEIDREQLTERLRHLGYAE